MSKPTEVQVNEAILAVFKQAGYVKDTGLKDKGAMLLPIIEKLVENKVSNKGERKDKAITREELVAIAFPLVLTPDQYEALEDESARKLAEFVYLSLYRDIWAEAGVSPSSHLQKKVSVEVGGGYVLCRTRVRSTRDNAIYITTDRNCIDADLARKSREQRQQADINCQDIHLMVAQRLPQYAEKFLTDYDKSLSATAAELKTRGQLAIEAAKEELKATAPVEEEKVA